MNLPYFVIASDEEEAKILKEWIDGKIGWYRMKTSTGKFIRIPRDKKVLLTVVIARNDFHDLVGSIRYSIMKGRKYVQITAKVSKEKVEKLDAIAKKMKITRSEALRMAIEFFIDFMS